MVAICNGSTIRIAAEAVAVSGFAPESLASTVKLKVPAVVGVPVIAPEDEVRVNPGGREPDGILQVYGVIPPLAETVPEYAVCVIPPAGKLVVVICSAAVVEEEDDEAEFGLAVVTPVQPD